MGEKYIFLGWACGEFTPQNSDKETEYHTLYATQAMDVGQGNSVVFGYRAEKFSCNGNVWEGVDLHPFDQIEVFFGRYNRVNGIKLIKRYEDKPSK